MWMDMLFGLLFCFIIMLFTAVNIHKVLFLMLLLSLFISFMVYSMVSSWLSIMIILLYAGGLLILFFYLLSLCSNKKSVQKKYYYFLMLLVLSVYYVNFPSNKGISLNKYSDYFVQDSFFSILIILLSSLLLVLWSMTKMTFNCSGPLRPWF